MGGWRWHNRFFFRRCWNQTRRGGDAGGVATGVKPFRAIFQRTNVGAMKVTLHAFVFFVRVQTKATFWVLAARVAIVLMFVEAIVINFGGGVLFLSMLGIMGRKEMLLVVPLGGSDGGARTYGQRVAEGQH